ncbi:hypothetical protein CGRA01v4_02657 [Colletotrichum graminicola]|nr:hypothetical protein CGRA01v4_02657 [Colletotrichum graminicola]
MPVYRGYTHRVNLFARLLQLPREFPCFSISSNKHLRRVFID